MIRNKRKFSIGQLILNILLIAFLAACIFPLLWMISSSLKGSEELFSPKIYLIPKQFTLDHYREVFTSYDIGHWFLNSVVTTFGILSCSPVPLPWARCFSAAWRVTHMQN